MNAFRQILKDRVAGAGLLAIIVQLLLVQALFSSFNCASMQAAAGAQPGAIVICHGGFAETVSAASGSQDPASHQGVCLDCPCGVCCGAAPSLVIALVPALDLGPAFASVARGSSTRPQPTADLPHAPPFSLKPRPTGPPLLSA